MILPARRGEGHELAQREKRHHSEEDDRRDASNPNGRGEDGEHRPPAADPRSQVRDGFLPGRGPRPARQNETDRRRDDQKGEDAGDEPDEIRVLESAHSSPSAMTAARALSRNCGLVSPGSTRITRPKSARESIGTGTDAPLGRMRFMLSR